MLRTSVFPVDMAFKSILITALLATVLPLSTTAFPLIEVRSNVCQSGIYGELAPILSDFPIAQAFCTAVYPVLCTTAGKQKRATSAVTKMMTTRTATFSGAAEIVTTTTSAGSATLAAYNKQAPSSSTTTSKASGTSLQDAKLSAWSKYQRQSWNVISTMCSCIESPKVCKCTSFNNDAVHAYAHCRVITLSSV